MLKFPHNFFWGSATSSHQVEGSNDNNDWWQWELKNSKFFSDKACQHYQLYKEDFGLVSNLNHNCHRFSLEWSRIQPTENSFSKEAINHYIDVIDQLRARNIEPVVTLHHFTNPVWFLEKGGWANKKLKKYFIEYVNYVVDMFAGKVKYWVTINEPLVYVYYAYMKGDWPPQSKSWIQGIVVRENLTQAHIEAYRIIHNIYKKKNLEAPMVSIAQNMVAFESCKKNIVNDLSVFLRNKCFNFGLIEKLLKEKTLDYIGINYYTRNLIDIKKFNFKNFTSGVCQYGHDSLPKNSMGWEIYPQGIYDILMKLKKYNLAVFILENGICTNDDNLRWEYISSHLKKVHQSMQAGVKILGYIYWSLLDNFEWDKGFAPRFGLIEVDYKTLQRKIRSSAEKFALVCKNGSLDE